MTHQLFPCECSVNSHNSWVTDFGCIINKHLFHNSFHTFGLLAWELLELSHNLLPTIICSAYFLFLAGFRSSHISPMLLYSSSYPNKRLVNPRNHPRKHCLPSGHPTTPGHPSCISFGRCLLHREISICCVEGDFSVGKNVVEHVFSGCPRHTSPFSHIFRSRPGHLRNQHNWQCNCGLTIQA
jgi:hypothetical protein